MGRVNDPPKAVDDDEDVDDEGETDVEWYPLPEALLDVDEEETEQ